MCVKKGPEERNSTAVVGDGKGLGKARAAAAQEEQATGLDEKGGRSEGSLQPTGRVGLGGKTFCKISGQ